jgi:hypothetical protein
MKSHILSMMVGSILTILVINFWPEPPEDRTAPVTHLLSPECDSGIIHKPYARKLRII